MKNGDTWNEKIEKNVKNIGEKSKGYKIMHIQEAHVISMKYKWLMFAGIILGPLSGLLSGIGAIIHPSTSPIEFPVAAACVGFISGIIVAITKFGKFEEKSSHHKLAASKYTSLESNIRRQLILSRNKRVDSVKYLEWIGNSFDDLFLASPLIERKIFNNYSKIAKQAGVIIPDEYELTINIDENYQIQKFNEMKNVSDIDVNTKEPKNENQDNKEIKIDIEEDKLLNNKKIKRSLTLVPELNQYSDGRMGYEMQRMMGLK